MIKLVLDVNVLVSALLSSTGAPATLLRAWLQGAFELVMSPKLLAELSRALAYPKIAKRIPRADADAFVDLLARQAVNVPDPKHVEQVTQDPADDYLFALARAATAAAIVSGYHHLTDLPAARPPVRTPRTALHTLGLP